MLMVAIMGPQYYQSSTVLRGVSAESLGPFTLSFKVESKGFHLYILCIFELLKETVQGGLHRPGVNLGCAISHPCVFGVKVKPF